MLTETSARMMVKAFRKTRYRFGPMPVPKFSGPFGVYLHVPFCRSFCTFCPFYKEIYHPDAKHAYLDALEEEIETRVPDGAPDWVYLGGGTPNVLTAAEVGRVLDMLRRRCRPGRVGMELHPDGLDEDYLEAIRAAGVTKVSLGVESLRPGVHARNARRHVATSRLAALIATAGRLGLWCNLDLMAGLPGQTPEDFFADVERAAALGPSQLTLYPYMVVGDACPPGSWAEAIQFAWIERAGATLVEAGYDRRGVWIWAKGDDVYDSSRDELVKEYLGLGPAAFSTFGNWKTVNPELAVYLHRPASGVRQGLVAPKTAASEAWRFFARMIYDLDCRRRSDLPGYILAYTSLLILAGYGRRGRLTAKGIRFAHHLTKAVVESLPYPLQNPGAVENWDEYATLKQRLAGERLPA